MSNLKSSAYEKKLQISLSAIRTHFAYGKHWITKNYGFFEIKTEIFNQLKTFKYERQI